jgi:hypothetical protein
LPAPPFSPCRPTPPRWFSTISPARRAIRPPRSPATSPRTGANSINASGFNGQATDYFSFGLGVASGFTTSVTQLLLGSRASATGPGSISLLASVDGGAFASVYTFTQRAADVYQTINFTDALVATKSIEFRLTPNGTRNAGNTGNTAVGGTFRVENFVSGNTSTPVTINGTVAAVASAVPEPATWGLMILGFGVVGGAMRRRQTVRVAFG